MFDLFSPMHIIVLLIIVLLIFGPKRLPELGKGLGQTMKMFRDGQAGHEIKTDAVATVATEESAAPMDQTPGQ
ncbi:twin-arginine translocase TatA/TatE family subunit [Sulfobacillus harzensis]|uniref:Sec-independent protein translocase protein TatA n=1 Tax=Sulfobacillus harzensis TaxID=2729629 RepID=A0A7Y0L507_9FIRM|nr:twin-arginine translocase TatA/TatE family subunit [Sulfobacillus harzensis]NMP22811.1 twin-arginine translocase TatA/TatE family subunit [Sulfobacillus harzensis]